MGWDCSVSKCFKIGKVGIWITLRCCSHTQGKHQDRKWMTKFKTNNNATHEVHDGKPKNNGVSVHWWHVSQYNQSQKSTDLELGKLLSITEKKKEEKGLTRLVWKMCKVGKVGRGGSLSRWSSKDVSSQVWEQVKLLLLTSALSLWTAEPWRLGGRWHFRHECSKNNKTALVAFNYLKFFFKLEVAPLYQPSLYQRMVTLIFIPDGLSNTESMKDFFCPSHLTILNEKGGKSS